LSSGSETFGQSFSNSWESFDGRARHQERRAFAVQQRVLAEPDFFPLVVATVATPLGDDHQMDSGVFDGAGLADIGVQKSSLYCDGVMTHMSTVDARWAARLKVPAWPGLHFVSGATIDPVSCQTSGFNELIVRRGPGKWKLVKGSRLIEPPRSGDYTLLERVAVQAALVKRYEWTVRLCVDQGPTIEFVTTSEDAREVFRWREKPPDGGRRPALRHWVSRLGQNRKREPWYLRGAVDFSWEGVRCKLLPPQFDRERFISVAAQ
jgi:hypothetical protein